jgi:DNA-binding NarL/FixJ family response regulator
LTNSGHSSKQLQVKGLSEGGRRSLSERIKTKQPIGTELKRSTIRVLVVDDYEPWRRFVANTLRTQPDLEIIGEAVDGLEAVHRAQKSQPDLILLDIGLPTLNGIEAAARVRQLSPRSKIIFLSETRSWDIVKEALRSGGTGYVLKPDAGSDLLRAVEAVLKGKQFISAGLAGHDLGELTDDYTADNPPHPQRVVAPIPLQKVEIARHHEAGFYSDDRSLLDGLTQFIGAALRIGNAAIVVATESHREGLLPRLHAYGLDVGAAIEEGRYIALDAAETVSAIMVNDVPDPTRFLKAADNLIRVAGDAAKGEQPRVAIGGECDPPLWTLGNGDAAIGLEQLWNGITKTYNVDVLCAYSLRGLQAARYSDIFQRLRAEHSAVHFR